MLIIVQRRRKTYCSKLRWLAFVLYPSLLTDTRFFIVLLVDQYRQFVQVEYEYVMVMRRMESEKTQGASSVEQFRYVICMYVVMSLADAFL